MAKKKHPKKNRAAAPKPAPTNTEQSNTPKPQKQSAKAARLAAEREKKERRTNTTAIVLIIVAVAALLSALLALPEDVLLQVPKNNAPKYLNKYVLFLPIGFFSVLFAVIYRKCRPQNRRTALINAVFMLVILLFALGFNLYYYFIR